MMTLDAGSIISAPVSEEKIFPHEKKDQGAIENSQGKLSQTFPLFGIEVLKI